jgi:phosphate:Na+ symporter
LRGLDQLRNSFNAQENKKLLSSLEDYAQKQANADNLKIDALIRDEDISPEMATSLLNDSDNVTLLIENLLRVNSFLYEV